MTESGSTPHRILREAAHLFSRKGYHGTTTREIADAVGVRQPSLFHHFASKAEIAKALYEYDLQRSPALRGEGALPDCTPPVRLYQGIRIEVELEITSAYDLRGLYLSSLPDEPDFARYREAQAAALAFFGDIIETGIESGDFVAENPQLILEVMDGVLNQTLRWQPENRAPATPDDVAALMLRLVLKRPSRIPSIRRAADRAAKEPGISAR
ncbi:TetR/AcrR family transcriptional regulator [Streptomyces sp. Inha503]|uniref:TetR/AcrR family transcriptional regulator n=1 Tax=Streptomyces sp. Inha503 TaxID=3383314 RepID=UPI0039A35168